MALDILCWILTNASNKIQTLYYGLKKFSIRGSQRVAPDPKHPCMRIPRPHPRPTGSPGVRPVNLGVNKLPG